MRAHLLIIGMLLLLNCKDPIEIEGEGSIGSLVVDGKITTLAGPYEVKIGYTVGVSQKPSPVSSAVVTVFDDLGNSEAYTEIAPGVYSIQGTDVNGVAGHSYYITVTLPDGKSYASKPQTIPLTTGTDTPSYDFSKLSTFVGETEVKTDVINVYVDSQLPAANETPSYFRWDVLETYMFEQTPIPSPLTGGIPNPCYVTGYPDPQRITLFSNRNQTIQEKKHTLVASRKLNYAFLTKHYFSIYMNSISLESYTYWQNVDQLINRSGSIFDTPPAPIKGNITSVTDETEQVFGYFEAANTSLSRFYVLRGDIPIALVAYCNDPQYGIYWWGYPSECSQCTLLDGSTLTPPDWWLADSNN
jgi:hypothetical protein